jgi:cation transport ATPase
MRRAGETKLATVTGFQALEGIGVEGIVDGKRVALRKPQKQTSWFRQQIDPLQAQGKTVIVIYVEEKEVGLIAMSDTA